MFKVSTLNLTSEGIDLIGETAVDTFDFPDSSKDCFIGPVAYSLHIALVGEGVLVSGGISVKMKYVCGRCLGDFERELSSEELCHWYESPLPSEIDLTFDLREDIVINIPQNLLCSDDCEGLCHACGTNLNLNSCECGKTGNSEILWKDLDELKF